MGQLSSTSAQLTRILNDWSTGDKSALERLTPLVYDELHQIARVNMEEERAGHVLQPSALVNEAFVRLLAGESIEWSSRAHFFAHAARLMRQVLIDFARAQQTEKRGNRQPQVDLSSLDNLAQPDGRLIDFLDLDRALAELADLDSRQAQVVELRYFGGLDVDEAADVLGISCATVVRDWRFARAWLLDRLQSHTMCYQAHIHDAAPS